MEKNKMKEKIAAAAAAKKKVKQQENHLKSYIERDKTKMRIKLVASALQIHFILKEA